MAGFADGGRAVPGGIGVERAGCAEEGGFHPDEEMRKRHIIMLKVYSNKTKT